MSENQPKNEPTQDWRELRRQEREARHAARGNGGWVFGAILVLVGILLFLQNMNALTLNNWWALFILLPGFGSLAGAWRMYSADGEITARVIGSLLAGLLFVGIAAIFLLNLSPDWTWLLPVLLILFGVGLLIPAFWSKR